jgi:hypothetical protein
VIASSGSIIDGDTAGDIEVDITAAGLQLSAGTGIGSGTNHLETTLTTLTASAGAGGLYVTESDAVTADTLTVNVNRVDATGTATSTVNASQSDVTSGGDLVLVSTAGSITTTVGTGDVSAAGNVLLKADGIGSTITLGATACSTGGNISVQAGLDILQNANILAGAEGRTIELVAARNIAQAQGVSTTSTNGNIQLTAGSSVTIESLVAGTGNVRVIASSGSIIDGDTAGDIEVDITAAGLQLSAGTGIGSGTNHLETTVTTLTASAGAGGLYVMESDAVTADTLTVNVNRVDATGTATSTANASQSDVTSGGDLVLVSTAGSITTTVGTGDISAAGNVLLEADGIGSTITLGATAGSTGGNISVQAGLDILQNANILAGAEGRTIELVAARNITQAQGVSTTSTNGNIQLTAGRSVTIETFVAGTGNVRVIASNGSIIDGDTAGDIEVDITAAGLQLSAGSGIGAGTNHLETTVTTLTASAGAGGLYVTESDAVTVDALTVNVNRVDATGTASTTQFEAQADLVSGNNGNIVLVAGGSVTLNDGNAGVSGKSVSANGTGSILIDVDSGDLMVNSDITSATGHITLKAAGSVLLGIVAATGVDISTSAPGTISIDAEGGDLTMAGDVGVTASGSSLRLSASGDITVGNVTAQNVSILSETGAIISAEGSTKNVTATTLRLQSADMVGAADRHLTTDVLEISVDPEIDTAGIYLTEDSDITVTSVEVSVTEFTATAGSDLVTDARQSGLVTGRNGDIVLVTIDGSITLEDAVSANGTGDILFDANGVGSGILINAEIRTDHGDISIFAAASVTQSADIITFASMVLVEAQSGSIVMDQGVQTVNGDGVIEYRSYEDVILGLLHAESGSVRVSAETGSITGQDELNVRSENAYFHAQVNVGRRNIQPLSLSVEFVAAQAVSGSMHLVNEGTITVSSIDGLNGLSANDGISLESLTGSIFVAAPIDTNQHADALFKFHEGFFDGSRSYFEDAGSYLKVRYKEMQYLWNASAQPFMSYVSDLLFDRQHDIYGRSHQNLMPAVPANELLLGGSRSEHELSSAHSAFADVKDGYVFFQWGEVPEADSYLLVVERDKMEFASRWLEEIAWRPFERFPAGIYEWSLYSWTTDGLKLVAGPMHFKV